jgi:hypothetical protein
MHPDILRDLNSQHGRELQEQAHRAAVGRTESRARRAMRRGHVSQDEATSPALPAIPDYVDGSFRTTGDTASGRVPAARHAA